MTLGFFFWLAFGLVLSAFPLILGILVMHVLMPQAVLDRYWKEPHFRPFELMLFSGWSFFAPYRTVMFMWAFMFPRLGKKRGIAEAYRLVPRWYRIVSIMLCVWAALIFIGGLGMGIGFYVYLLVVDRSKVDWRMHTALAVTVTAFGFVAFRQWRTSRKVNQAIRRRSNDKIKRSQPSRREKHPT